MTSDHADKERKQKSAHQREDVTETTPSLETPVGDVAQIMRLQRLLGNKATERILRSQSGPAVQRVVQTPTRPQEDEKEADEFSEAAPVKETPVEAADAPPAEGSAPPGTGDGKNTPPTEGQPPPPTDGTGTPQSNDAPADANTPADSKNPPPDNPQGNSQVISQQPKVESPQAADAAAGGENPVAEAIRGVPTDEIHAAAKESAPSEEKTDGDKTPEAQTQLDTINEAAAKPETAEAPTLTAALNQSSISLEDAQGVTASQDEAKNVLLTQIAQTASMTVEFGGAETEAKGGATDPAAANGQQAQQAEASGMATAFLTESATHIETILDQSTVVTDRLNTAAETARNQVMTMVVTQQAAVAAHIAQLRAQARSQAQGIREQIDTEHTQTLAAIKQSCDTSSQTIETEHQNALKALDEHQTAALARVNELYGEAEGDYQQVGVKVGDEAITHGEEKANSYLARKINEMDSLTDGYLTDRKMEASAKAAREVAKQYKQGLIDAAKEQTKQMMAGKAKDIETLQTTINKSRETLKTQKQQALDKLKDQREADTKRANEKRRTLRGAVGQALASALQALDQQKTTQHETLAQLGELHQNTLQDSAHEATSTLQQNIFQAASGLQEQLGTFQTSLNGAATPDMDTFGASLDSARTQVDTGIAAVQAQSQMALAGAEQNLLGAAQNSATAIMGMAETGISEAQSTFDALAQSLIGLGTSVGTVFSQMREGSSKTITDITDGVVGGFKDVVSGFDALFQRLEQNLQIAFAQAAPRLYDGLRGAFVEMNGKMEEEAQKAADKEQPAWKGILKIVLIIAVIVVVALVVGPFVIGAVGAFAGALGASAGVASVIGAVVGGAIVGAAAGATTQIGNNLIDGKHWTEGVGNAMIIGAIGGALGGAGGALGQALSNAGRLGSTAMTQAIGRFGVDAVFNVTGTVLGNLATGQPITWEGVMIGVASAAGASLAVGGIGRMGRIGEFVKNTQTYFKNQGGALGNAAGVRVAGTLGITVNPKISSNAFTVDPSMQSKDIKQGVMQDGRYVKNPTAKPLNPGTVEVTPGGKVKVDGKLLNGEYMYVVDMDGNITFGGRGGQHMPHPTLIGGENPQVQAAGMMKVQGGKIIYVDNGSGHFKPGSGSLEAAEKAFQSALPQHAFGSKFEGFKTYDQ